MAERVPEYDVAYGGTKFRLLALYAGDASDYSTEATRYEQVLISYELNAQQDDTLILTFAYVRPHKNWELLDIRLGAPISLPKAVERIARLQSRLFEYLRSIRP